MPLKAVTWEEWIIRQGKPPSQYRQAPHGWFEIVTPHCGGLSRWFHQSGFILKPEAT